MNPARRIAIAVTAAACLWLAALSSIAAAPAQSPSPRTPAARPASIDGAELFATTCQICHGPAGIGAVGAALRGPRFTADFVRKAMTEGRPGTMMPQFTGTFSPAEIAAVARYVADLQGPAGPAAVGLRGSASAGEDVFFMRGSARSCAVCHSIEGRGGNVGPELMPKIARMTPRELFQKIIVVPHRSSDPAYRTVKLTTRHGTILTGLPSGHSGDAVLFYDTATLPPVLRTIPKSEIVHSAHHESTVMPTDYASRLTLQQLLDVVAFLKSVSGDPDASVTLKDVIN